MRSARAWIAYLFSGCLGCGLILAEEARLSLSIALQEALNQNRNYRISDIEARTAAERVSWGRAGAWPKVDLTAVQTHSLTDTHQQRAGSAVENKTGAQSTSTAAGVLGTWTVFEGFAAFAAHDKLEAQAKAAGERRSQVRQDIAAAVTMAYVDVVRQQTMLAALDSAVSLSSERLKITEGKYGFGSVSKLDLLQAKLDLNEDLSARIKQEALYANARSYLNQILARSDTDSYTVEDSISLEPVPAFAELLAVAVQDSPELRQAALNQSLASAAYREFRGHLFPQVGVSLGYNYGLTESDAGFIRSNEALGWNYGVNLKFNIFEGGVLAEDYRNARATGRQADLWFAEVKAKLETALSQNLANHRASLEIVGLERVNLDLARENVALSRERWRLGSITSLELRMAQEKFVAAETRLVTAKFECKRAETELLRLSGRLAPAISKTSE